MPIQYPKASLTFSNASKTHGLRSHHLAQLIDISFNTTGWDRNDGTAKLYLPKPIDACPMVIRNVDGLMDQTWWLDIYRFDRKEINSGPLLPSYYGSDFVRMFTKMGQCELLPIGDDWLVRSMGSPVLTSVNSSVAYQYSLVLGRVGAQSIPADTWTDVEYNSTGWGPSQTALSALLNPEYDSATRVITPANNPGIPLGDSFKVYPRWVFADPGSAGVVCEARCVNAAESSIYHHTLNISDGVAATSWGQNFLMHSNLQQKWQVRHNHSGALDLTGAVIFYFGNRW